MPVGEVSNNTVVYVDANTCRLHQLMSAVTSACLLIAGHADRVARRRTVCDVMRSYGHDAVNAQLPPVATGGSLIDDGVASRLKQQMEWPVGASPALCGGMATH